MKMPPEEMQDALRAAVSPYTLVVALSRWIVMMKDLDAEDNVRFKDVRDVLLNMLHCWAEELARNPSYSEMASKLTKEVVSQTALCIEQVEAQKNADPEAA